MFLLRAALSVSELPSQVKNDDILCSISLLYYAPGYAFFIEDDESFHDY